MKKSFRVFLHILAFVAIFAAATAVVMLLWNALIPSIIGWSAISYCQAAGLIILSKLLFGGFGRHGNFNHWGGRHNKKQHREFKEKMKNMSRDERREFIRQRMIGNCCEPENEKSGLED
ncbi:hypothetical protein D0T53_02175 [Dysgonomonas sp. 216]|uniref:hypothetical protein n=1 Tax=Dysgonomonas sp. 216 TaxID=2302934 RepID=UPI0013D6DFC6|nr:hypothetical protein [Dysgonomonas sp. 216]NDW17722.1 hypothetical protein [Dysgonomonas sp. 216]